LQRKKLHKNDSHQKDSNYEIFNLNTKSYYNNKALIIEK